MRLAFTDQYANILFLVNGLAILLYLAAKKKKKQRAMSFGNYETLQKVAGKDFLKSSNILLILKIAALTSLIVGISSPVIVQDVVSTNTDYIVAIDSSTSMLSSDFEPTRFEASKEVTKQFIEQLGPDLKVGVIGFSGSVTKVSGITEDRTELKTRVEALDTGSEAGTAIGDAIYTGTSMLIDANRSRTIILVTDGRNNVGSGINESIKYAKSHNVTIKAIGIGEKNGSEETFETLNGQNASRAAYPNLDTGQLERISNATGGNYTTVTNSTALKNALLNFEKSETRTDVSIYFIFGALILVLSEWMLGTTRYSILP